MQQVVDRAAAIAAKVGAFGLFKVAWYRRTAVVAAQVCQVVIYQNITVQGPNRICWWAMTPLAANPISSSQQAEKIMA